MKQNRNLYHGETITMSEKTNVTDMSVVIAALNRKPRESHLKLGPSLLARKASPQEIAKAFTDSFNSRGIFDSKFIAGRTAIYMRIASRKAAAAARTAKK